MKLEKIPGIWLRLSAFAYLAGLVALVIIGDTDFLLGFAAGGALVLINAVAASRRIARTEFSQRGFTTASLLGGFYLRLALLGLCLFGLIKFIQVDAVGLVAGLSVVPAGLVIMIILIYLANRRPEEV